MAVNPADDKLPCGHHAGQLWDSLSEGTPQIHSRSCPHCQAALAEIRPVAEAIRQLAAEPVSPPADLAANVMNAIRARIHRYHRIQLPAPAGMRLNIREQAATAILRAAADRVDGARTRSCRLICAPASETLTGVQLTISVRYGTPVGQRAAAVRAAVRAAARSQLGLALDSINIDVTDIYSY
jgi:hypothetical protein